MSLQLENSWRVKGEKSNGKGNAYGKNIKRRRTVIERVGEDDTFMSATKDGNMISFDEKVDAFNNPRDSQNNLNL